MSINNAEQIFPPEERQKAKKENYEKKWYGFTLLCRLILTLFSFEGLFFIYNIIIEYIILFPILFLKMNKVFQIFLSIFYILFALLTSDIILIPTYEFITFPFLRYKNPFIHLFTFITIKRNRQLEDDSENTSLAPINYIFLVIEIIYVIFFIIGLVAPSWIILKDFVEVIIFGFFFFYYLLIIFCYFFISCYFLCPIIKKLIPYRYDINDEFQHRNEINDINLVSYVVNPLLNRNYVTDDDNERNNYDCEKCCDKTLYIIKVIFIFLSIIGLIIIFISTYKKDILAIFFFILLYVVISTLILAIHFPMCYRNRRTTGKGCVDICNNFNDPKVKYLPKIRFPVLISTIRFLSNFIVLTASCIFVFKILFSEDKDKNREFKGLTPSTETIDEKELLLPSICYSSVFNIPIQLYIPFINDAYYYNDDTKTSSFDTDNYKNLFFDDQYTIEVKGNLIKNNDKGVKMIQYNIENRKNNVTVLSIKGTSYKKDLFLDAHLYFPSLLLNLLSTFSTLDQQKELTTFKFIEYALSIPYRIFFQFLIIDDYLEELIKAYKENEHTFNDNVIIVGHSLGGGLAKIFGRLIKKQAISLSGPGVNAFHSLWEYEGDSDNFELTAIDLIPDMDLVPRVDISGGTIYRIVCIESPIQCHYKELSLCEVLIMCRHPNYHVYCKNVAELSDEEINHLVLTTEFNNNNNNS